MTLRGVGDVDAGTLVLDVGGGSTELIMRDRSVSIDIGSVRLTERFGEDVDAIAAHVRPLLPADLAPARAIGVAATVTSLAALDLGLAEYDSERVHGHVLTAEAVEEQLRRLASLPLERAARFSLRSIPIAPGDRRRRDDRPRGHAPLCARRARGQRARPAVRRCSRGR